MQQQLQDTKQQENHYLVTLTKFKLAPPRVNTAKQVLLVVIKANFNLNLLK